MLISSYYYFVSIYEMESIQSSFMLIAKILDYFIFPQKVKLLGRKFDLLSEIEQCINWACDYAKTIYYYYSICSRKCMYYYISVDLYNLILS
jgi:hypothetical protein